MNPKQAELSVGMQEDGFERIVEMSPAFDRRNSDPNKNYGIHGVDLRFVLKGELGAISFCVFTNWHLPHVRDELMMKHLADPTQMGAECTFHPNPSGVHYHSPKPLHAWQKDPTVESCSHLDGKPCYSDGSSLMADDVFEILVREGSEGVWNFLRRRYDETFLPELASA